MSWLLASPEERPRGNKDTWSQTGSEKSQGPQNKGILGKIPAPIVGTSSVKGLQVVPAGTIGVAK